MQVVHARCCGLDVHKKTVVACVVLTKSNGQVEREVRTFGTMTVDILALSDWLTSVDVCQIAMESTGVFGARSLTCSRMRPVPLSSSTHCICGQCLAARPM
jgi:hypothetical protein